MKKRIISLLLVFLMVLGCVPAVSAQDAAPQTIRADFMADAKAMSRESFWKELKSTSVDGLKVLGYDNRFGEITQSQCNAYESLRTWLSDNAVWNIDEDRTKLNEDWLSKRLFLNAGDGDYGLRLYTGQYLNEGWASSFYLTVQAQAAGTYSMQMSVRNENGNLNIDGCCGGGFGNIYVNDVLVRE